MNAKRLAALQASLAEQPDIHAEVALLLQAIDRPARRSSLKPLGTAAAVALAVGTAGQALAKPAKHVVVAGESLYRIAARELGSGSRWKEIARLNHLSNPRWLQIGQELEMPAGVRSEAAAGPRSDKLAARTRTHAYEVVPAGVVVAELPARRPTVAATRQHASGLAGFLQGIAEPHSAAAAPITPAARVPLAPAAPAPTPHGNYSWILTDALAFLIGTGVGAKGFERFQARRASVLNVAAPASAVPVPDFWSYVPGSQDLQALSV